MGTGTKIGENNARGQMWLNRASVKLLFGRLCLVMVETQNC